MANGIFERQGNLFIDGYGYAGKMMSCSLPVVEEVMQEHSAGGMGGTDEIPMGRVNKMEATYTLKTVDPRVSAVMAQPNKPLKYRASAIDQDGNEVAVRYELRGRVTKTEESEKTPDGEMTISQRMIVKSYKKYINDSLTFEIDIENVVFKPDGKTDVWAGMRKSMGI